MNPDLPLPTFLIVALTLAAVLLVTMPASSSGEDLGWLSTAADMDQPEPPTLPPVDIGDEERRILGQEEASPAVPGDQAFGDPHGSSMDVLLHAQGAGRALATEEDECDPHPPIEITEEEGLSGFTLGDHPVTGEPIHRPGNGVVAGDGSKQDPYIIEGWCLGDPVDPLSPVPRASRAATGTGVLIEGTESFVLVRANQIDPSSGFDEVGIHLREASNVHVEANGIVGPETGVLAEDSQDVRLEENTIAGTQADVQLASTENAQIQANAFTSGVLLLGSSLEHFVHTVEDNTVQGEPLVYLQGTPGMEVTGPAGQVIVVNAPQTLVQDHDFEGVASGIQVAYSQGTHVVENTVRNAAAGTGTGDGADGIHVHASPGARVANNTVLNSLGVGIFVHASNETVLENNTANDGFRGIYVLEAHRAIVANNTADGHDQDGIFVTGSDDVLVEGNTAAANAFSGVRVGSSLGSSDRARITANTAQDNGWYGIRVGVSQDVRLEANVATGQTDGFKIEGTRGSVVANNTGEDNSRYGIHLTRSIFPSQSTEDAIVEHNLVSSNRYGIAVWSASDVIVRNNEAWNNEHADRDDLRGYGIWLDRTESTSVEHNTLTGNDGYGLYLTARVGTPAVGNSFENNVATENEQGGVRIRAEGSGAQARDTMIRGNNLFANVDGVGLSAEGDAETVDARWNWWGCPQGPDEAACEDVEGSATYDPWRSEPNEEAGSDA